MRASASAIVMVMAALAGCASSPDVGIYASTAFSAERLEVARQERQLKEQISSGREAGTLSRSEARGLKRQVRLLGNLADRFDEDGLSDSEASELETFSRALQSQIDLARFTRKPEANGGPQ
ncbi:hypothetical protein WAB17_09860 [Parerythrobacter aurantius]|uniref:hypothetical protein n=1 Tax=Parerythrobacter aurantius TaxID=3127706 RepID=UPI0032540E3A